MRVVCVSDTHGLHDELQAVTRIPDGDVFVHAGDFTDTGERDEVLAFNAFLATLPHKYKIVVAGNHESSFDRDFYPQHWHNYGHRQQYDPTEVRALLTNALYLEDQAVLIDGFLFYGTPWQPEFCSWAFNLPRGDALVAKWKQIPEHVDVLVTHSPPLGRGDHVGHMRVGCADLLREVQTRVKPTFHVFGHVHEGYGTSTDGVTTFLNASSCTHEYEAVNPPMVVELKTPRVRHDPATNQAIRYEVLLHEQLRVCSQKPPFVPAPSYYEPRAAGPHHGPCLSGHDQHGKRGLKEFSVEGTTSALLFESTLKLRPVKAEQTRALRYLFHQGFQNGAGSAVGVPDAEDGLQDGGEQKGNTTNGEAASATNAALIGEARREARRRASLSRRVTMGVIEELSDTARGAAVEPLASVADGDVVASSAQPSQSAADSQQPPRRARRDKTLHRREAVAKLATMVEEPELEKEAQLVVEATDVAVAVGTEEEVEVHVETKADPEPQAPAKEEAPAPAETVVEAVVAKAPDCIMCKYNVPGHVHGPPSGVAAAPAATTASTKAPAATVVAAPAPAPAPAQSPVERAISPPPAPAAPPAAECIMCKYKVVGHVHPGSEPANTTTNGVLLVGSAAADEKEDEDEDKDEDRPSVAARAKAIGSKRLSSWF